MSTVARWLVRLAALLVPGDRRREWWEEWAGELAALERVRATAPADFPTPVGFALGAFTHAMWMRKEGWTVDNFAQDVRYSARVLRRAPGFTLVAALTLALGVGANATIFSLINGLVLRSPAGVHEPDRLVQIARSYETDPRWDNFSWPAMKLIEREARTLAGVAGFQDQPFVIGSGADATLLNGQLVTGSYFDVLGVRPHAGRLLQPSDDVEPGGQAVVVLGHGVWDRLYGRDPSVVGSTILIGASPYEVIGVAPEGFRGVEAIGTPPELFVPAAMHPGYYGELPFEQWGTSWINVVGRMEQGVTFEQARASMEVVTARLRDADPVNEEILVLMTTGVGLDPDDRREATQVSLILMVIVGLVLLLTCTNVANLFLARASARRGELGVRLALGAGRSRLVRQLVTESLLVAGAATLLAAPLVALAGDFLPYVFPYNVSVSLEADGRVYAFLVAIGLFAGLLFGLAPAWAGSRRDVAGALRDRASTEARAKTRLRDALVVWQLALSLSLVAGAALLGRSVLNARMADPGFEASGMTAGFLDLAATGRYDRESGERLYGELLAAALSQPEVGSATVANQIPIAGGHSRASASPAGREDEYVEAEYIVVGPGYFETMGIPLLRGRALRGIEDEPERVVVVNEALADALWPGEDPIGKELAGDPAWRVVGLVPDVQMRSLRSAGNPAVYYPLAHRYAPFAALQLKTVSGEPLPPDAVRAIVSRVDPALPVPTVVDVRAAITDSMAETRTIGYLVGAFAMLALLLAAVGLYGLVSYGASQRVREIGIRVALGAEPESLVRLILARGITISVLGVLLGVVISIGLGAALESLLFGVGRSDPWTLTAAALVLVAASATAAWVPARRASRVDAVVSLRD